MNDEATDIIDIVDGYATIELAPPMQSTEIPRATRLALQSSLLRDLPWGGESRLPWRRFVIYWRGFLTWSPSVVVGCGDVIWHDGRQRQHRGFAVGLDRSTLRSPTLSPADLLALHVAHCRPRL